MEGGAWDAGLDLLLGSGCVGCARPGRVLCRDCAATLPRGGHAAWPSPTPAGLCLPVAAGRYDGLLRAMVLAHKERRRLALARPLGRLVAGAVADLGTLPPGSAVRLVPVPSPRPVVRNRGHDPLLRLTRAAAAALRREGTHAVVDRLLVPARRPADQAGLGAQARADNLAGAFRCLRGGGGPGAVVLVDDVVTTGATLREAQRALEEGGVPVAGAALVAATARRHPLLPARGPGSRPGRLGWAAFSD